jgi:hypothetical protein
MWGFIKQVFSDATGVPSTTRLLAFELVNAGIFISIVAVYRNNVTIELIGLITSLITIGITGKVVQSATSEKEPGK